VWNNGSSTPSFIVAGNDGNGSVGVATTSPSANNNLDVVGNSWIQNASTTNFSAGTNLFNIFANGEAFAADLLTGATGQVSPMRYLSFQLSTSTTWTASSSASSVYGDEAQVVMPFAGTIRTLACATNAGTLEIESSVNSTNDFYPASTTAGTYTYSNTFTRGQIMQVIGGAPASAPTIIPCTIGVTQSQ
jgi:hypothetical protein